MIDSVHSELDTLVKFQGGSRWPDGLCKYLKNMKGEAFNKPNMMTNMGRTKICYDEIMSTFLDGSGGLSQLSRRHIWVQSRSAGMYHHVDQRTRHLKKTIECSGVPLSH
jgi:hypothetical protein